jgi:long-chain acyl-CoA synthetase
LFLKYEGFSGDEPHLTLRRARQFNRPMPKNLTRAFVDSARRHRDKTAVFWGADEITYDTLLLRAAGVATHLIGAEKIQPGDRVALWMKKCPEFNPAYFGILLAGGVVVPVNNFLKPDEIAFILRDAAVRVVIYDESLSEGAEKLTTLLPDLRRLRVEEFTAAPSAPDIESIAGRLRTENDLAVLVYTSGTTGHPKGAMLSHGNLLANVESCREKLAAVDHDRFVVLLPMFHSFMMTVGMLLPLLVGGSMLLIKSVHPPKNVILEILQRRATILPAVPQFFRALAHGEAPPNFPLRLCISGGAPLPAEILKEFNERMPVPLIEGYGLSEASPVVSFNPIDGSGKAGSIGLPITGVEVSVQSDDGTVLGVGQTGEICVRGANVMQGYWNQPEETAKSIRDGWLLTGDIGHRDADGYFFITDRKKDMLLVNGINVYPREIEEIIYQFPGVKEAAVIGVPDPRRGEQPVAYVSAKDGTTLDAKAIQQFVRERLADYKVPKHVTVLAALPRNATGKILKTELRKVAQSASPA